MQGTLLDVQGATPVVQIRYAVGAVPESWVLTEDKVPESTLHNEVAKRLEQVLEAWAGRTPRNVRIGRNLAVRWLEQEPRIGIDPDVCVLEPAPEERNLTSLRLWQPGQVAPPLCFEVVSANHPHKDYRELQDRYAAMGTKELIVFDPQLLGPRSLGGPVLLQKWRRHHRLFEREAFGDEPVHSEVLGAWLLPRAERLDVADDREGTQVWQTEAERQARLAIAARAEKERERAEKERERAEKERAQGALRSERVRREALEQELAELRAKRQAGQ